MGQLNFDSVKKEIRSVLISVKQGLTLQEFLKQYRSLVGIRLPSRELGYTTDIDFLNSISDVVRVQENRDGSFLLKGIADETTKHIQKLVQKQKCVKKKTPNKGYVTNIIRHNQMSSAVDRYCPFIPALLRAEIIQVVKQHPEGIGYTALAFEYQRTFLKNLNLTWLSTNPSERLEKLVIAVPELKLKTVGNAPKLCFVNSFQYTPKQADVSRSRHQNIKDAVLTSPLSQPVSSVIPMSAKRNCEMVLKLYSKGIVDKYFPILYQKCTNQPLNLHELGFVSLIDLADALPDIFFSVKLINENGWILFHVDNSKYAPEKLDKSDIKTSSSDTDISIEDVLKDIALPSLKYIESNLPVEAKIKFIPVFISAIINPNCFWFQLLTEEAIQSFKRLEKEMENFYMSSSTMYKMKSTDIAVGAICATFCKDDCQWYRTIITAIPTIDSVVVDFVDYGTSEKVPRHYLYYLRKSFTHLPAQGFQAELAFVKPANKENRWKLTAQKRFHDLCNRPYLMAQINSVNRSVASIFLCDSIGEDDIHINDILVQEGHAEYCVSQTSDYESSSELSDESLSDHSLQPNLLQAEMVTENDCFSNKADILVNPQSNSEENNDESSQFFCKRVLLDEKYFIHILSIRNEAYVSGSEFCNLFWKNKSEDLLADRLKFKNVVVPTLSVSRKEFKNLFEKCERYSVKGFHDNLVTLYPVKYAVKILNTLGHPSEIARETFIYEMDIFDPSNATWQELSEESKFDDYICDNGDAIESLCLYDLKAMQEGFRYKRIKYLESFKESRNKKSFEDLKNLDKTLNAIIKRIKEIEEICCSFSDYNYS